MLTDLRSGCLRGLDSHSSLQLNIEASLRFWDPELQSSTLRRSLTKVRQALNYLKY